MEKHTIPHGLQAYNENPQAYEANTARLARAYAYMERKHTMRLINAQIKQSRKSRPMSAERPARQSDGDRARHALAVHKSNRARAGYYERERARKQAMQPITHNQLLDLWNN